MKTLHYQSVLVSVLLSMFLLPSHAQDVLEEITVTAQKREQAITDVPISITAFSGETMRELGIDNTMDLAFYTPGLTMGQNSGEGDFPHISLRGVTVRDFADTNESPSAVYIDEFYKANLMGLDQQIFDLQRAEVLRGPQGTLYGRNATGGLIHYVSNKPTREFTGYGEVTYGERDRIKFEGAAGGPLSEQLSGRISVLHHQFDGYTDNTVAGNADGNALDATSVRGQLLFEPTDDFSMLVFLQRAANDNDAGNMFPHVAVTEDPVTGLAVANPGGPGYLGFIEPTPDDPRDTHSDRDIYLRSEQYTAIGRLEWSFNDLDFVSVTGYEKTSKDANFDSDGTPFARGTEVHPNGEQFSQEFRVSGEHGSLQWLAGFYYIDYEVDGWQARCARRSGCAFNNGPVIYDLQTESWAVFANTDFQLTQDIGITAGLRYTEEEKDYVLDSRDAGYVFNQATAGDGASQDDGNLSFNFRLNLTPLDDVLVYAGVARGYKAGTFNVGYTLRNFDAIPVGPEELTSYEGGIKAAAMDNRVRISGAVFHYDYDDSQAFQFDGSTLSATAFNRDAEVNGFEVEISAAVTEGFDLFFTSTYLDAKLIDVTVPGAWPLYYGLIPPENKKMPLVPDWKISFMGRYEWSMPGGSRLAIQGDMTYYDDQFFDAYNSPSHFEDDYVVGNARLTWYSADDRWKASVFAENIGDTEYRTYAFDLAFLGFATDVYGKPRWVGGTIGYSWR